MASAWSLEATIALFESAQRLDVFGTCRLHGVAADAPSEWEPVRRDLIDQGHFITAPFVPTAQQCFRRASNVVYGKCANEVSSNPRMKDLIADWRLAKAQAKGRPGRPAARVAKRSRSRSHSASLSSSYEEDDDASQSEEEEAEPLPVRSVGPTANNGRGITRRRTWNWPKQRALFDSILKHNPYAAARTWCDETAWEPIMSDLHASGLWAAGEHFPNIIQCYSKAKRITEEGEGLKQLSDADRRNWERLIEQYNELAFPLKRKKNSSNRLSIAPRPVKKRKTATDSATTPSSKNTSLKQTENTAVTSIEQAAGTLHSVSPGADNAQSDAGISPILIEAAMIVFLDAANQMPKVNNKQAEEMRRLALENERLKMENEHLAAQLERARSKQDRAAQDATGERWRHLLLCLEAM